MKNNSIFYNPKTKEIFRILDSKKSKVLVINCIKKQMPYWTEFDSISSCRPITEDELQNTTGTHFQELTIPSKEYKYAQERFSLISNIIPIIGNKSKSIIFQTPKHIHEPFKAHAHACGGFFQIFNIIRPFLSSIAKCFKRCKTF